MSEHTVSDKEQSNPKTYIDHVKDVGLNDIHWIKPIGTHPTEMTMETDVVGMELLTPDDIEFLKSIGAYGVKHIHCYIDDNNTKMIEVGELNIGYLLKALDI